MSSLVEIKQKNIAVIGGGTGTSIILEGLKKYPVQLTAIVNMFDNGGSSGWLRRQLGVLPPGDLRQCARALSESKIWQELLEYRFERGVLKGQCFGNLLISVVTNLLQLSESCSRFKNGFKKLTDILSLKGKIIPVSLDNSHLFAELKNGKILKGEDKISASKIISKIGVKKLFLKPAAKANPSALAAIKQADVIVIAPGNLYAGIIPNFLANGIPETIRESSAKKIYVCNLENVRGHTDKWTEQNYIEEIEKYLGKGVINAVICGNKTLISKNIYKQNKADKLRRTPIRHDSEKIAKAIYELC